MNLNCRSCQPPSRGRGGVTTNKRLQEVVITRITKLMSVVLWWMLRVGIPSVRGVVVEWFTQHVGLQKEEYIFESQTATLKARMMTCNESFRINYHAFLKRLFIRSLCHASNGNTPAIRLSHQVIFHYTRERTLFMMYKYVYSFMTNFKPTNDSS